MNKIKEWAVDKYTWLMRIKYKSVAVSHRKNVLEKIYKKKMGYSPDIEKPKTFNERIQWQKLFYNNTLLTDCADKIKMKSYVEKKVGNKYVVPTLATWDSAEDVEFSSLPDAFIIKANHGCHMNYVVNSQKSVNHKAMKQILKKWINTDQQFNNGFEMQYENIERKLFAEELLDIEGQEVEDYKVWCFAGVPIYIQCLSDRKNGLKMSFYDTDWVQQSFVYTYPRSGSTVEKPKNLEEMLSVSKKLAEEFPFVRVDFYVLKDDSLKVGELTFTPAGGFCKWQPKEYDAILGNYLNGCLPPI